MLQRTHLTCLALLTFFSVSSQLNAQVTEFETTRMKSTGGAGVGSLLMDESTVLNPAPIAFFNSSAMFYQRSSADIEMNPSAESRPFSTANSKSNAFIVSDSKGSASGSISYINQEENGDERRTFGVSLASAMGKKSAFGINYKFIKDTITDETGLTREDDYKQAILGVTHVINQNFSLGVVAVDPFQVRPNQTKAIVGLQYVFEDFISLMFDAGADYNRKLNETTILRAAAQIKLYDDFFLRFGAYNDEILGEEGTGFGIGWMQPRLTLEFALKNSTSGPTELTSNEVIRDDKETSFSLAYRF
jgi:hypothetical protein